MQTIYVYDSSGELIPYLVQWDREVMVYAKESVLTRNYRVHFFNTKASRAYVVDSEYDEDTGILSAKIPNVLLRESYPITGYIYVLNDEDKSCKSICVFYLRVQKRPEPTDYAYEGEKDYVDITEVLDECWKLATDASNSATLSESYAVGGTGTRDGEDEDNSKYYSEQSAASAQAASDSADSAAESEENAAQSASDSADSATLSESYAKGGTGTRDGEDTDNSKYYSEQASESAQSASDSADAASKSEANASESEANATQSAIESAQSAQEASDSATLSESYAIGGTGTRDGEDTDNSKYYSEQSAGSAQEASEANTSALNAATSASMSEANASEYEASALASAVLSESYAVGGTETRDGEDEDNAKYYYEALKDRKIVADNALYFVKYDEESETLEFGVYTE